MANVTSAGIDATDNSCNNCAPQNINIIKEELSLSSVSDDDVGPSISLQKKSTGMMHKGKQNTVIYVQFNEKERKSTLNLNRKKN